MIPRAKFGAGQSLTYPKSAQIRQDMTMDEETRKKIMSWAEAAARQDDRISEEEVRPLNQFARDRYAFERGAYEHALQPHWGIGVVMNDVINRVGADIHAVADMVRTELEDGDEAAEAILDASNVG